VVENISHKKTHQIWWVFICGDAGLRLPGLPRLDLKYPSQT